MTRKSHAALSPVHRNLVFAIAGMTFISGAIWAVGHFAEHADHAPLWLADYRGWLAKLHGGFAMLSLVALGSLLPQHVNSALKGRRNKRSGIATLATVTVLGLTGYGLYYFGDDTLRNWTEEIHIYLGLAGFLVLVAHVYGYAFGRMRRAAPVRNLAQAPAAAE
jgi:cation transport ATPase